MSFITDGTGSGYLGKVNSDNRFEMTGDTESTMAFVSQKRGKAYALASGLITVTTSDTGRIFYWKNTSSTESFIVEKLLVNWNGGSTNYNKTATFLVWSGDAAPTANNTTFSTGVPLNYNFSGIPPATVERWDGTSPGLTSVTGGAVGGGLIAAPGNTQIPFDGALVYGPGFATSVSVTVPEDGQVFIAFQGYFKEL